MKTLKEHLTDWVDWDVAAYHLGATLGLFPEWPEGESWDSKYKGTFWSANPLGDTLYATLRKLSDIGVLDRNDNGFRWNSSYVATDA